MLTRHDIRETLDFHRILREVEPTIAALPELDRPLARSLAVRLARGGTTAVEIAKQVGQGDERMAGVHRRLTREGQHGA